MADKDNKHPDQFNASLPLPIEGAPKAEPHHSHDGPKTDSASADIIRKRVQAAYQKEPDAQAETEEVIKITDHKLSKHQQFIFELTSSGKPMHEIQTEWHDYYIALPEADKHRVWDEFYESHPHVAKYKEQVAKPEFRHAQIIEQYSKPALKNYGKALSKVSAKINKTRRLSQKTKASPSPIRSLAFGLSVGSIAMLILLFSFFNERFISPFIQPSRTATNAPIISSSAPISNNPEVIIPKINVQIPVIYDIPTINESQIDQGLENGVVHYADTAMPGQNGNVVIVGHSSNNIFNPGKYKFAFVLLSRMEIGDTFYLQKDGKRYTYQIYDKKIVKPTDVSVLGPQSRLATATLITCDPPGTSTNRLVVTAEQIDPSVSANTAQAAPVTLATKTTSIPGNSISLWSRLIKWLTY